METALSLVLLHLLRRFLVFLLSYHRLHLNAEQCLMVSLVSIKNVLSAPSLSAKRPLNVNTVEVILNRPEYYQ
nr:MAG TPA: hypothetical protein [Caudoviricetes sp.]